MGGESVLEEQEIWEETLLSEEIRQEFETMGALLATSALDMERRGAVCEDKMRKNRRDEEESKRGSTPDEIFLDVRLEIPGGCASGQVAHREARNAYPPAWIRRRGAKASGRHLIEDPLKKQAGQSGDANCWLKPVPCVDGYLPSRSETCGIIMRGCNHAAVGATKVAKTRRLI
eukprot:COSAG02_NODE_2811_length_7976_cov_8.590199_3_plen_174_part_00